MQWLPYKFRTSKFGALCWTDSKSVAVTSLYLDYSFKLGDSNLYVVSRNRLVVKKDGVSIHTSGASIGPVELSGEQCKGARDGDWLSECSGNKGEDGLAGAAGISGGHWFL